MRDVGILMRSMKGVPLIVVCLVAALAGAQQPSELERTANAIVAGDGSAKYRTVQEAIDAVPQNTTADAEQRWM